MNRKIVCIIFAAFISCGYVLTPLAAHAGSTTKKELSPSKAKILRDNVSYSACRKSALKQYSGKKQDSLALKKSLVKCDMIFPNIALYKSCKADALAKFKAQKTATSNALKYCLLILDAMTFKKDELVQIYPIMGKIFHASVNLSDPEDASTSFGLANFDCSNLQQTYQGIRTPDFLLFGETVNNFPILKKAIQSEPKRKLNDVKSKDPFLEYRNYGRFFKNSGIFFFPTASCSFSSDTGKIYSDHQVFYLLNFIQKKFTPYFGVSFFTDHGPSPNQTKTEQVAIRYAKKLGPKFKLQKTSNGTILVVEENVTQFDLEGDPKNLCLTPRVHKRLALVKPSPTNPVQASYVLVANIKNLCEFGDSLASRNTKM